MTSLQGIAAFNNIAFMTPATGCKLTATSPGFETADSRPFDLLP
jgi:hypothetical protein